MASDQNTNTNPQTASIHLPEHQNHQPIRRGTGRRKPKANEAMGQKKKTPQRGMGVAQLEKLRAEEGGRNPTNQTLNINPASFSNLTVMNPNSVSMQFARLGGFGTVNGGVGHMGLNQNQPFFGFQEQMGNCNVCHKKKRVNGEILGCSRGKSGMYMQMSPMANCDFLGLNLEHSQRINQQVGIEAPIVPLAGYSVRNCQPGVEVVAFHRKGNSSSGNGTGTVLMEYDFFPGNGNGGSSTRITWNNEFGMMNSEPSSQGGETSSSIDLSLKLSY